MTIYARRFADTSSPGVFNDLPEINCCLQVRLRLLEFERYGSFQFWLNFFDTG